MLYWNDKVHNIDEQWNTYELPEPVMTPNGFFVGLGYDGFLSLATDDGITHPYQFIPERHFAMGNMHFHNEFGEPIETWGFQKNLMLRAHGYRIALLQFEDTPWPSADELPDLKMVEAAKREVSSPQVDLEPMRTDASYHVFLDDMQTPFASWLYEQEYLFTDLPQGTYTAGVQTAFSTTVSEVVDVTFTIEDYTSVEDFDEELLLSVYPNPARHLLNIDAGEQINEIYVFDMLGQMVYSKNVSGQSTQINTEQLREGVYLLQIATESGLVTHRVRVVR